MQPKIKDKKIDELISILTKLGEEKSLLMQMKMYVNTLGDFVESIWQDGHDAGFALGKKDWIHTNKN